MPKQFLPLGSKGVSSFGRGICDMRCSIAKDILSVSSFLWKLKLHTSPFVQCLALASTLLWSLQARQGNKQLPALFCVPFIVKDNFDTAGMAGTAGSVALLDNFPMQDAQQVRNAHAVMPSDVLQWDGYEDTACLL